MFAQRFKAFVFLATCSLYCDLGHSEWRLGAGMGPYMPSNNPGITNVMKSQLVYAGYVLDGFGVESTFLRSSEDGAVVNYGRFSGVMELTLPEAADLKVVIHAGFHQSYNRRASALEYERGMGFHTGGGIETPVSGALSARAQFSIMNGPGRAVTAEVGLLYVFGRSAENRSD